MEKLQWKVKHKVKFNEEDDFLASILESCGVVNLEEFLNPSPLSVIDPFKLSNMQKGIDLLDKHLNNKIFMKVDCDADGYTSSAYLTQFLQKINPKIQIEHGFDFNKKHGVTAPEVLAHFGEEEEGLVIIPDASILAADRASVKKERPNVEVLIIDHHLIEEGNEEILKDCVVINNQLDGYPNPTLSGVGVVHKFCSAYCEAHDLDIELANEYLDLVALGMIADNMSMLHPETRYLVTEGLKPENLKNEFLKELRLAHLKDMFKGELTFTSIGWTMAPNINGVVRYGKDDEQIDLFRAMYGVQEDREYQPRRKKATDPKPPLEIHSLQKTMARVCGNVKSRQDAEVRRFQVKIKEKIEQEGLDKNSVILIDGTDILTKNTVTGLVANKIASEYKRPALIFKEYRNNLMGGSGRNYAQCNLEDLRGFLEQLGLFNKLAGHPNAFGIEIDKNKIAELTEQCNEKLPLSSLSTVHEVDYEVVASSLTSKILASVADSYKIWCQDVPEPKFAITNLVIKASEIQAYGTNGSFIRFTYRGIPFIKKYCPRNEYSQMTLATRNMIGKSKKVLKMNIIGSFIYSEYEGKVFPQVKILNYDVEEYKEDDEENWVF